MGEMRVVAEGIGSKVSGFVQNKFWLDLSQARLCVWWKQVYHQFEHES